MGSVLNKIWGNFFNMQKDVKILMLGLDAAGKTTILFQFKLGEQITSIPTIGFNVEEVQYKNINFTMWDVGGQKKIRSMWHHYVTNSDALIYVVDSQDTERLEQECKEELHYLLSTDELKNASVLIYANKQDLPGSLSVREITEKLEMSKFNRSHEWYVQSAIATRQDGLYEGLDWLS